MSQIKTQGSLFGQGTIPQKNRSYTHQYPRTTLILLTLFCQFFGIISPIVSAATQKTTTNTTTNSSSVQYAVPPKTYIYVRTNPVIDDSWIGTLVSFTNKLPVTTVLTGSTQTTPDTTVLTTTNIIRTTNTQWIEDWNTSMNQINGSSSNTEFNSAPLLESMQNAFSSIFDTIFGRLTTDESNINTLSSSLSKTNTTLNTTNNTLNTNIANTNARVENLSGSLSIANNNIASLSGALATTNTRMLSLGGGGATYYVQNPLTFSSGFTQVGNTVSFTPGANGEILSMSGGIPTWIVPGAATAPVTSVFGRIGIISAQSGDYNTSMITESGSLYYTQARFDTAFGLKSTTNLSEGTNLYFTNTRAQNALSGTVAGLTGSIASLSGVVATKESLLTFNNGLTRIGNTIGLTNGSNGEVLSMSGGIPVWLSPVLSSWSLSGNSGINPLPQFIGTTDNTDLVFKRNNIESFRLSGASGNLITIADAVINGVNVGHGSGNIASNTILGIGGLSSNTTGNANIAIGGNSLYYNSTGSNNVAVGYLTLYLNTIGYNNIANGAYSLYNNTTGSDNTAIGIASLFFNTTGTGNTANGSNSLRSNTTGSSNTANGIFALRNNTTGSGNTADGRSSLINNTTGSNNTALGSNTAGGITTGSGNTILGANVLGLAANLSNNIIIADGDGNRRINVSSTGAVGIGTSTPNYALDVAGTGAFTGFRLTTGASNGYVLTTDASGNASWRVINTTQACSGTGVYNTCYGNSALSSNTSGAQNTAFGSYSMWYNTTGSSNTAYGMNSLQRNISGDENTAQGIGALYNNTTGNNNTAQGVWSLFNNTSGIQNSAIGRYALLNNATGSNNTSIGHSAGSNLTSGNNNIAIGVNTNFVSSTGSNQLNIGDWIYGTGGSIGIGTSTPNYKLEVQGDINAIGKVRANGIELTSDARFKQGVTTILNSVDVLSRLNPVTYTWNLLGQQHGGKSDSTEYGFLAQDVELIIPGAVSTNADGYKSLNYIDFIPHLVGAMKQIITTESVFSGTINTLTTRLDTLTTSVNDLTTSYTTMLTNLANIRNTLNTQSLALAQMQGAVVDLQSQIDTIRESNQNSSGSEAPVINNYYTTVIQTGSTNTGTTTVINNYYITGSISSGSTMSGDIQNNQNTLIWTHSGELLAGLTGSGMSGSTYTGVLITPRDAYNYISGLFEVSTDIVHDFISLQITAVHGYFDQIWTKKITTRELVASGAIIEQLHTNSLCVKKSNGTDICLTGDQLEMILTSAPVPTPVAPSTPGVPQESTDSGATLPDSGTSTGTTDSGSVTPQESTDSGATLPDSGTSTGTTDSGSIN